MKAINFFFKIRIKKCPTNREWKVLICANRSANFKPIILTTKKIINLNGCIEGFSNYLNLNKNNIENTILYFYSFIKDKNNELQIKKCKRYKLVDLIAKREKEVNMRRIVLLLLEIKIINTTYDFLPTRNISKVKPQSPFPTSYNLNNYIDRINEKLKKTFHIKRDEQWHVIYHNLDVFRKSPIISSVLMDSEQSNELFWVNLYKGVKKIFEGGYGIKWDPKVCWVNLFTAINNFCHNYVYENRDIYMESWFTRGFDCDETKMAFQLYTLFCKCSFKINEELKLMQSYCKNQYIAFTEFCYVNAPSAIMSNSSSDELLGHWILRFILEPYFYDHWIDREGKFPKLEYEKKNIFLYGETTAPLYPSFIKTIPKTKGVGDKKMRFLEGSKFYKRTNTLTTTEFLGKGIPGFYCGRIKGKVLKYGIPFKNNIDFDKIVFVSFPKIGKKFFSFAKTCAEQSMPIPNLLAFLDDDKHEKIRHYECFVTMENIKEKIENIQQFFRENFELEKKYVHKHFLIYSLDQLMDKKIRKRLIENFGGNNISVDVYELMYKTYTFGIKVF